MPGKKPYYTLGQVKKALRKTGGLRAPASRLLAQMTGRGTGYRGIVDHYIDRHPELKVYVDELLEDTLDVAEHKLLRIMKNDKHKGQLRAVTFLLQTKGKNRGYVRRQEMTGEDGGPMRYATVDEIDMSKLSDEELGQLDAIFAKARVEGDPIVVPPMVRPRLNGHASKGKKKKRKKA
jgi:hypothetical protein